MSSVPVVLSVGAATVFVVAAGLLWATQGRDVFLAMVSSAVALCF